MKQLFQVSIQELTWFIRNAHTTSLDSLFIDDVITSELLFSEEALLEVLCDVTNVDSGVILEDLLNCERHLSTVFIWKLRFSLNTDFAATNSRPKSCNYQFHDVHNQAVYNANIYIYIYINVKTL